MSVHKDICAFHSVEKNFTTRAAVDQEPLHCSDSSPNSEIFRMQQQNHNKCQMLVCPVGIFSSFLCQHNEAYFFPNVVRMLNTRHLHFFLSNHRTFQVPPTFFLDSSTSNHYIFLSNCTHSRFEMPNCCFHSISMNSWKCLPLQVTSFSLL